MKVYFIIFFLGGAIGYSMALSHESPPTEAYIEESPTKEDEFKKDVALLKSVAAEKDVVTGQCPEPVMNENFAPARDIASIDDEEQQKEEILAEATSEEREIVEKMPDDFFLMPMEF